MIYDKLVGFAGFGFPKSHAAAFGLLAYQSAWLRRYYPAEFLCALLNAQPMGFYPPSSLVRDAQRRGVEVRPPHVNRSEAQCTIENGAVRVGIGYVQSVGEADAQVDRGRTAGRRPWRACSTATVKPDVLEALVAAGTCDDWGARRQLLWHSASLRAVRRSPAATASWRCRSSPQPRSRSSPRRPRGSGCSPTTSTRRCRWACTRSQLLRPHLPAGVATSAELPETPHGTSSQVAGMAIARQRPSTANGVVFMLLEDEHGAVEPDRAAADLRAVPQPSCGASR